MLSELCLIIPRFFDIVSSSALHVYSIIPFLQDNSVFRRMYMPEARQGIKVIKIRGKIWNPPICELRGHAGSIKVAQFSPNGKQVLTTSNDGTSRIWDPTSGQTIFVLEGCTGGTDSAQFSPSGKQILIASGNSCRVWDSTTGQVTFTLEGHTRPIKFVPNSNNRQLYLN